MGCGFGLKTGGSKIKRQPHGTHVSRAPHGRVSQSAVTKGGGEPGVELLMQGRADRGDAVQPRRTGASRRHGSLRLPPDVPPDAPPDTLEGRVGREITAEGRVTPRDTA